MHPLWSLLEQAQDQYFDLLARIRGSITNPHEGDAVRNMMSDARLAVFECHDFAIRIIPALSQNEHFNIGDRKTGANLVSDATIQDQVELLARRLSQLDSLAKIEIQVRRKGRLQTVPWGGIKSHEREGRHLIAEHVEKSLSDLQEQLDLKLRSPAASSFPDIFTADRAAADVLANRHREISAWLESGSRQLFKPEHECDFTVGEVLERGGNHFTTKKVKLVLVRDNHTLLGYQIKTGFPIA